MTKRNRYDHTSRMLDEWGAKYRAVMVDMQSEIGYPSSTVEGRAMKGEIGSGTRKSIVPERLSFPTHLMPYSRALNTIMHDEAYCHLHPVIQIRYMERNGAQQLRVGIHRDIADCARAADISRASWEHRLNELFAVVQMFVKLNQEVA